MKRLVIVFMLVLAFAFPVSAGHSQPGGAYCECTPINGVCPCCSDHGLAQVANQETDSATENADSNSADSLPEFALLLLGVLVWLRLKA
jgi:hypothetical protein